MKRDITKNETVERTPDIVRAAYDGNVALVRSLIEQGASVNSVDPADNLSLLHIACLQGDRRLVELILEREGTHGDVDFAIQSHHRPRLAWQFAVNANFLDIATLVDDAGLAKAATREPSAKPS